MCHYEYVPKEHKHSASEFARMILKYTQGKRNKRQSAIAYTPANMAGIGHADGYLKRNH